MADLNDLQAKRVELSDAIAAHTAAVASGVQQDIDTTRTAAQARGDELAKLIQQVKNDDPNVTSDDDLFSNPGRMNALVRDDIAGIMTTGQFLGGAMKLLMATEDATGGINRNVILSFASGSNVEVDWGDGTVQTYTGAAGHTYAQAGQYEVKVTGTINGFTTASTANRKQLKDVMQWGGVEFASAAHMFDSRTGFTISASDSPNFLPGASAKQMLYAAVDFNSSIDHWDMSNVVNAYAMLARAEAFNQPLNSWDVSGIADFSVMFQDAIAFNQPLDQWDTSAAVTMM